MNENPELAYAVHLHQSGNLAAAGAMYRKIVERDPENADAWAMLGTALHQTGQNEHAVQALQRAIELKPRKAMFHANLARVLHAQGSFDEAARSSLVALRLEPDNPKALNNYGGILLDQDRLVEAEGPLRRAVRLKPDYADGLLNLGRLLSKQKNWQEALGVLEQALKLAPENLAGRFELGISLMGLQRFTEAAAQLQRVAKAQPSNFRAHYYAGLANLHAQDYETARTCFERAIEADSEQSLGHFGLGYAYIKLRRLDAAEACLRTSLFLEPNNPLPNTELGMIESHKGRYEEGRKLFEKALSLDPHCAGAHFNLGYYHLMHGEFEKGWREFLWFREIPEVSPPHLKESTWHGQMQPERSVVLRAEQGFGDMIQFLRYAPLVKARVGRTILECPLELQALAATAPGIDEIASPGQPHPQGRLVVPILNLPRIFETRLDTIPNPGPYLRASRPASPEIAAAIDGARGFRVGLVWQGRPSHPDDARRSMPATHFEGLQEIPGVSFFSLQKGFGCEQLPALQKRIAVIDLAPLCHDFADTAAAIEKLDLVLTVDTSVLHLGGALGKPVWALLPFVPEWRWLREREDSPWYASVRLFRQQRIDDWPSVIAKVREALQALVGKNS